MYLNVDVEAFSNILQMYVVLRKKEKKKKREEKKNTPLYAMIDKKLTVKVVVNWSTSRCSDGGVGDTGRDATRTQHHATGQLIRDKRTITWLR